MPVGQIAKCAEEGSRGGVVAALTLNRFDEERGHLVWFDLVAEHALQLIECHSIGFILGHFPPVRMRERRHEHRRQERVISLPILRFGGRVGHGSHGPTVESTAEHDDALPPGGLSRQLHRRFDRLCARVHEHKLIDAIRGHVPQCLGGANLRLVSEGAPGMPELVDLLEYGGLHPGVLVPHVGHRDSTREVQVPVARRIGYPDSIARDDLDVGGVGDDGSEYIVEAGAEVGQWDLLETGSGHGSVERPLTALRTGPTSPGVE